MTIHQAILHGERVLSKSRVQQPRWNSERLLALALQKPRAHLYANLNGDLGPGELSIFEQLLSKRAAHYPLAYLEGTQEFYGRQFFVNDSVLIPRPETEELIRAVLSISDHRKPQILDIGSGSGCIAVTLSLEIPQSFVVALELSSAAITVLVANSRERVHIVRGDFHSLCFQHGSFDAITANLPYVEQQEYEALSPETKWEPKAALIVDSLEQSYKRVMEQCVLLLKQDGYLVMEFGYGQSERLRTVAESISGLQMDNIRNDQQGIPRVLILRRPA